MRKVIIYIMIITILLCMAVCYFLLSSVVLWQGIYFDNKALLPEENKKIKALLLDAIKDRCSSLYKLNAEDMYDFASAEQIIQYDVQSKTTKSWFSLINPNFMSTATKTEHGTYQVTVKLYYPESYYYCFEVGEIEGRFLITFFQIDI